MATNEVSAWLQSIKMGAYVDMIVVESGCDTMESVLEDLDDDALEGRGVKPFHRKRILRAIAALREEQSGGGGQANDGRAEQPAADEQRRSRARGRQCGCARTP